MDMENIFLQLYRLLLQHHHPPEQDAFFFFPLFGAPQESFAEVQKLFTDSFVDGQDVPDRVHRHVQADTPHKRSEKKSLKPPMTFGSIKRTSPSRALPFGPTPPRRGSSKDSKVLKSKTVVKASKSTSPPRMDRFLTQHKKPVSSSKLVAQDKAQKPGRKSTEDLSKKRVSSLPKKVGAKKSMEKRGRSPSAGRSPRSKSSTRCNACTTIVSGLSSMSPRSTETGYSSMPSSGQPSPSRDIRKDTKSKKSPSTTTQKSKLRRNNSDPSINMHFLRERKAVSESIFKAWELEVNRRARTLSPRPSRTLEKKITVFDETLQAAKSSLRALTPPGVTLDELRRSPASKMLRESPLRIKQPTVASSVTRKSRERIKVVPRAEDIAFKAATIPRSAPCKQPLNLEQEKEEVRKSFDKEALLYKSGTIPRSSSFKHLQRMYQIIEKIDELESIAREIDSLHLIQNNWVDFDTWMLLRRKEKAEKELAQLYGALGEAQKAKQFLYQAAKTERWKGDCNLRLRDSSVEDLRKKFLDEQARNPSPAPTSLLTDKEIYKPLWRTESVLDVAHKINAGNVRSQSMGNIRRSGSRMSLSTQQLDRLKDRLSAVYSPPVPGAGIRPLNDGLSLLSVEKPRTKPRRSFTTQERYFSNTMNLGKVKREDSGSRRTSRDDLSCLSMTTPEPISLRSEDQPKPEPPPLVAVVEEKKQQPVTKKESIYGDESDAIMMELQAKLPPKFDAANSPRTLSPEPSEMSDGTNTADGKPFLLVLKPDQENQGKSEADVAEYMKSNGGKQVRHERENVVVRKESVGGGKTDTEFYIKRNLIKEKFQEAASSKPEVVKSKRYDYQDPMRYNRTYLSSVKAGDVQRLRCHLEEIGPFPPPIILEPRSKSHSPTRSLHQQEGVIHATNEPTIVKGQEVGDVKGLKRRYEQPPSQPRSWSASPERTRSRSPTILGRIVSFDRQKPSKISSTAPKPQADVTSLRGHFEGSLTYYTPCDPRKQPVSRSMPRNRSRSPDRKISFKGESMNF